MRTTAALTVLFNCAPAAAKERHWVHLYAAHLGGQVAVLEAKHKPTGYQSKDEKVRGRWGGESAR